MAKSAPQGNLFFLASSVAVLFLLFLTSFNLHSFTNKKRVLGVKNESISLLEEKDFWQATVVKHPTYLDAWLNLARIESQLGNDQLAQEALKTAKIIAPNSPKVLEIENQLF